MFRNTGTTISGAKEKLKEQFGGDFKVVLTNGDKSIPYSFENLMTEVFGLGYISVYFDNDNIYVNKHLANNLPEVVDIRVLGQKMLITSGKAYDNKPGTPIHCKHIVEKIRNVVDNKDSKVRYKAELNDEEDLIIYLDQEVIG